ncbi:hypothetical protein CROQUDRAFT_668070 [Cronartium quercuum f. sp. fusiforme G11]|uniref:Vacuolar ATPase assembly integral membrane protein VMA21 n=1 Tax=Cronartium quercuum f. sp. fusiforme G11 TaxID=708437 RepID=A0A9P6NXF2_9BASI|nr:hypothetical protein CROQUDRAFT_668070 [Cronartium quercuum f. sp. fusiforme G11]
MSTSSNLRSRQGKSTATDGPKTSTSIKLSKSQPHSSDYNAPIFKLGLVSISMAVLPIATYYGTLGRVFEASNTTAAAVAAIVVTNVILISYVILAVLENDGPELKKKADETDEHVQ